MREQYEFVTQTQIGKHFGVSSHDIGKWLVKVGLREGSWPSEKAKWDGLVKKIDANGKVFFAWHRERTISELERHGYRRLAQELDQPADDKPLFGVTPLEGEMFEIIGPTDKVSIRTTEKVAAEELVRVLNLAAKCGKLASLAV